MFKHRLLFVGTVSLVVRLLFVVVAWRAGPDFVLTDDSQRYDRLALSLVHRYQFAAEPFTPEELGLPSSYREPRPGYLAGQDFFAGPEVKRVPGFAIFLGLCYRVFGYRPLWFLGVQAALGSLTCVLILLIGRQLGLPKVGFVAALLHALNPRAILHVGQIQVEVFFVCLLVLCFYLGLRYVRLPSWGCSLAFGASLAYATLAREMGLFLVLVFLPMVVCPVLRIDSTTRLARAVRASVVVVLSLLSVGAWTLRNHYHYGYFFWTAHTHFQEAWFFAPQVLAAAWHTSEEGARLRVLGELVERYPEYASDVARLQQEPRYYWTFNHRVEFNLRASTTARRLLLQHPVILLSSFATGGFASAWAGVGEWRGLLLKQGEYSAVPRGSVRALKSNLARFQFTDAAAAFLGLVRALSARVWIALALVWALTLFLFVTAGLGLRPLFRLNPVVAVQLVVLVFFAVLMAGPAANNRLFSLAYPFLGLLSACGVVHFSREPASAQP